jgi:hypothetical protein
VFILPSLLIVLEDETDKMKSLANYGILRYMRADPRYHIFACSSPIIWELILTYCYCRHELSPPLPEIFYDSKQLILWAVQHFNHDTLNDTRSWNASNKYPSEITFQSELYAVIGSVLSHQQFAEWKMVCEAKCWQGRRGAIFVGWRALDI